MELDAVGRRRQVPRAKRRSDWRGDQHREPDGKEPRGDAQAKSQVLPHSAFSGKRRRPESAVPNSDQTDALVDVGFLAVLRDIEAGRLVVRIGTQGKHQADDLQEHEAHAAAVHNGRAHRDNLDPDLAGIAK